MPHDLFTHVVLCNVCHTQMTPRTILQDSFPLRALACTTCNTTLPHPGDLKDYEHFKTVKDRQFHVKLRMVGNSFCVSIPRELIAFHQLEQELNQMVNMMLQAPNKIIIDFNTKLYKNPQLEDD